MRVPNKQWEFNSKVYRIKSSAIKAATISVTASKLNMGDYVTETTSMDYDEETRDIVKQTNNEYWISDRILITK